jgi:hypothetical protein
MLMFKNDDCRIYYYNDLSIVHVDWNDKMAKPEGFRQACEFALRMMAEKNIYKMIADNSKVPVVMRENQAWLTEDWFPRAINVGFRYSAVVVPDNKLVEYTIKKIEHNIDNNLFTVQYFASVEEAKAWLASL